MAIDHDAREPLPGITPDDDLNVSVSFPEERLEPAPSLASEAKALVRDILFAIVTAILIVVFVIQPVKVEGTSMLPRLHDGERIFVNKFIYALDGWPSSEISVGRSIERGDIVVFWFPEDPDKSFIKRVIGLPGDTVRIDEKGRTFINGEPIDESYLSPNYTRKPSHPETWHVKKHYYFVMGDNRDASNDSRTWGLVPEKYIYGQACFRYWPLSEIGVLNH